MFFWPHAQPQYHGDAPQGERGGGHLISNHSLLGAFDVQAFAVGVKKNQVQGQGGRHHEHAKGQCSYPDRCGTVAVGLATKEQSDAQGVDREGQRGGEPNPPSLLIFVPE